MSAYERNRLKTIKANSKVLAELGISDAVTSISRKLPGKKAPTKPAKRTRKMSRRDDASDASDSVYEEDSEASDSDFEAAIPKRVQGVKSKRVAQEVQPRSAPKRAAAALAAEKSAKTSVRQTRQRKGSRYSGVNLKQRRIKVSIFTEDTGKHQWHFGTILAARTRQGRLEHLVKWDTMGEEDEWLNLEEEKHHLIEDGEEEVTDEDVDGVSWRVGQCVSVYVDDRDASKLGAVRLVEALGGDQWRVGWFVEVDEVPHSAWGGNEFESGKDIFYTVDRQQLSSSCFARPIDVVCYTTSYRTVLPGQRRCRYVWDPARQYLHRFTLDGKWTPELGREIRQMLAASRRTKAAHQHAVDDDDEDEDEATVEAVAVPGRTGGARREGPELSDSDSDAQEEEEEEEEDGEEGPEEEEAGAEEDRERSGGDGTCSAGGYWAALAGVGVNQTASLTWDAVEVAEESQVAACMQRLPLLCASQRQRLLGFWRGQFVRWRAEVAAGFSLCFFGFGSKRALIRDFVTDTMTGGPVVEVNAFASGLRLGKVLAQVLDEVAGGSSARTVRGQAEALAAAVWEARVKAGLEQARPTSEEDAWESMMEAMSRGGGGGGVEEEEEGDDDKYAMRMEPRVTRGMADGTARSATGSGPTELTLVIHNIESPALQGAEAQDALCVLAAAPGIHLVASVDHVNAPLAWTPQQRGRMQWVWADMTTMRRYVDESPYAAGGGGGGGEEGARSAGVVLRSLNRNARGVFGLLVDHQLKTGAGLPFQALYERSREQFLVSSELALRGHLTEMKDHKLLRERQAAASAAAARQLYVPLPAEALRGLLAEVRESAQLSRVLT